MLGKLDIRPMTVIIVGVLIIILAASMVGCGKRTLTCSKVTEREIENKGTRYELDLENGREIAVSKSVWNSHPVNSTYCY